MSLEIKSKSDIDLLTNDEVLDCISNILNVPISVIKERSTLSYIWNLDEFNYPPIMPLGRKFSIKKNINHLIKLNVCSSLEHLQSISLEWVVECLHISLSDYYLEPFIPTENILKSMINCMFFTLGLDLNEFINNVCWQFIKINSKFIRVPYGALGTHEKSKDGSMVC